MVKIIILFSFCAHAMLNSPSSEHERSQAVVDMAPSALYAAVFRYQSASVSTLAGLALFALPFPPFPWRQS
ncbi:hypothetical protein EV126DRAFT_76901 [Verticillium dahliae]|nr:hypothetical protein EV126DRAFT_76901 [Verticillium dahliae]